MKIVPLAAAGALAACSCMALAGCNPEPEEAPGLEEEVPIDNPEDNVDELVGKDTVSGPELPDTSESEMESGAPSPDQVAPGTGSKLQPADPNY